MNFTDATELSGVRMTRDGYLAAHVKAARTGVQVYRGEEVGRPELDTVNVYRGEDVVFAKDSMASFVGKPVTLGHPDEIVNADNWKTHAVGQIGEEIARDGEAIRVSLALMDAKAIKAVKDGTRQLSVGYSATLEWGDGIAPDGTAYQARQKDIFVDHLAVVAAGKAGPDFRIGDDAADGGKDRKSWGATPLIATADERTGQMADNLRTVMVDGFSVSVTDQAAQAIEKLTKDRDDARKAVSDAKADHDKALADKDKELADRDAKIADLEKKVLDDAALDKRVQDRAALIDKARKVAKDIKTEGVSDADIRKAAVIAVRGEDAVKDKSAAYVDAAFDLLTEGDGGKSDPVHDALRTQDRTVANDAWSDSVFASAGIKTKKEA